MKHSAHPTVRELVFWHLAFLCIYWMFATAWNAQHAATSQRYDDLPFEGMVGYWERKKTAPCALGIAEVYDDDLNPDCSRKSGR